MPIRTIIYVFYYEEMGAFVPCKIINVWSPKSVINIAKNMECQHITQPKIVLTIRIKYKIEEKKNSSDRKLAWSPWLELPCLFC